MVENAYIHIPFCRSRCKYCSFTSFTDLSLKEDYLNSLLLEIEYNYKGEDLKTLYIGGGTPSLLTVNEVYNIISKFNFNKNSEITMESNPDSVDEEYLKNLKGIGINRVSFGCQTFNDEILKIIGRRHTSKMALDALSWTKKAGFKNINFDFIYGLPNQTIEIFTDDLKKAVELGINHISLYGLKIDEGCYFYDNMPQNIADNDTQADMYVGAINLLENLGFIHYEISNFAKEGFQSRHNLNYWNNNTYYGFGCSAHGYVEKIRYSNSNSLKNYIKNPTVKEFTHEVSKQEGLEEEIFLGFRKMSGININEINKKYEINFNKKYEKILKKYSDFITKTELGFKLNNQGILISNIILSDFLE